ncbi:MAG: hypothetical protein JXA46_12745 [Dehalococcoidales bacterium]|nr:hypothetical protein [Dehalococcoidales bacterium]
MKNQEEKPDKEAMRVEKLKAEDARLLAKEQARTKVYLAREQEIERVQKLKENQRAEERAREEATELVKEKARREAYLAREKIIAREQETRKLKNQGLT